MESVSVARRESQVRDEIRARDMVVFTPRDVSRFLDISRGNAYRIIGNMSDKGLVRRVEKGKYMLAETWNELDVYEIVPEIFTPSYIAFWSALHFHKMTDQVPRTVFMATTKRKRSLEIQGERVRYVTVKGSLYFGYERYEKVVVSDREKTVIDCLRHPQYSGGLSLVYDALTADLNTKRLVDYCARTKSSAIASRLGYMLDKKGLDFNDKRLKVLVNSYTKLDPEGRNEDLDREWKLYVNRRIP